MDDEIQWILDGDDNETVYFEEEFLFVVSIRLDGYPCGSRRIRKAASWTALLVC